MRRQWQWMASTVTAVSIAHGRKFRELWRRPLNPWWSMPLCRNWFNFIQKSENGQHFSHAGKIARNLLKFLFILSHPLQKNFMWNTLSIQYSALIEEEWDEHYKVTCEYGYDYWKTVTFPFLDVEWVGTFLSRDRTFCCLESWWTWNFLCCYIFNEIRYKISWSLELIENWTSS